MENYTLNTESKDIVGGINEIDDVNQPAILNGDHSFWGSQEEGIITGTVTQTQYNAIKECVEKGLPVIIQDAGLGYICTYRSMTVSPTPTPGRYTFCFIDYNTADNNFFLKWFRVDSDLTCQVFTKRI